ncbi:hypothetical protein GCM10009555_020150 [Acrocarpospora macrocephala]|uniref:Uncharacterized protein n=1 Tax=Acrocarpospora macrocephala TaxID=150177 RepID=A0A5M3WFV6_9ACTN|nr:hypothetical protein [Acrocarpospora macrocephala]GES07985.1 hypothetical protein Amac_015800 [Acrocarpospora macrocephala]
MREMSTWAVVGRGALVGLAVGIVMAVIWVDGLNRELDGIFHYFAMFIVPFPFGAILTWLLQLPRLWVVALVGAFATIALTQAIFRVAPVPNLYGFDDVLLAGIHLLAGVLGYVAAAWVASDASGWWSRVAVVVSIVVLYAVSGQVQEPARRWHQVRGFEQQMRGIERLGVPLVAPDIPDHSLSVRIRRDNTGPALVFRLWADYELFVLPGGIASLEAACANPYPSMFHPSWSSQGEPCRPIAGGRWLRGSESDPGIAIFARYGDALIQLESQNRGERHLLPILDGLRPVSARWLAERTQ